MCVYEYTFLLLCYCELWYNVMRIWFELAYCSQFPVSVAQNHALVHEYIYSYVSTHVCMYVCVSGCGCGCGLISIPSNCTNYTSAKTRSASASASGAVIDQINEQYGNQADHWNHSAYSSRAYIEYIEYTHNACEQPSRAEPSQARFTCEYCSATGIHGDSSP